MRDGRSGHAGCWVREKMTRLSPGHGLLRLGGRGVSQRDGEQRKKLMLERTLDHTDRGRDGWMPSPT